MWLSDVLRGTSQTDVRGKGSDTAVQGNQAAQGGQSAVKVSQQVRSFTPGQTVQGEVVSKNGSEVQIRLSDDMVLSARLEREIAIEVGKHMTFEVKSNGSALALSPLFANMSADANVLKAIDMASLPLNGRSLEMTQLMMQQGMSIDKNAMQSMYRDVASYPSASVADIVQLRQLGMAVNPDTLAQLENYKALQHQLLAGMDSVLEEIPAQFEALMQQGDAQSAIELYLAVAGVLTEESGVPASDILQMAENAGAAQGADVSTGIPESVAAEGSLGADGVLPADVMAPADVMTPADVMVPADRSAAAGAAGQENAGDVLLRDLLAQGEAESLIRGLQRLEPEGTNEQMAGLLERIREGSASPEEIWKAVNDFRLLAGTDAEQNRELAGLLGGKAFGKLLKHQAMRQWLLKPEDVQQGQRVAETYERLSRQLAGIRQALAQTPGGSESGAMKSVASLQSNLDFMNRINQLYSYVQLPLNMSGRETHGELYVYTNKRHLAQKDGNVSALLHLDMEHLGAVDVYVAMQNQKVNTKFYLRDDEMIDFIQAHIHILNERLEKRGYSMNCEMLVREPEQEGKGVLDHISESGRGSTLLSQYAFDVRA